MASPVILTKKQKRLMKERRRKKKLSHHHHHHQQQQQQENPTLENASKRPREDEPVSNPPNSSETQIDIPANNIVCIPPDLSPKELKKFRKDVRRQARKAGRDENLLKFVDAAQLAPPAKKRKREFPKINDLVKQEKEEKEREKMLQASKEAEEKLSDEEKAKYVALDCEMVGIGSEGKKSALARVSMTNWNGDVVLDTFVQVPTRVTDFRTHVSGVTPKDIKERKAMPLDECRAKVAAILKDKVLVGHALKNDLHALMLTHPKHNIRDTAKFRRYQRYGGNKWRPRKLRDLAKENLGVLIQQDGESHDSVDDARAAMELYKLSREMWETAVETTVKRMKTKK